MHTKQPPSEPMMEMEVGGRHERTNEQPKADQQLEQLDPQNSSSVRPYDVSQYNPHEEWDHTHHKGP
jgi:hypothetical protein